MYIMGKAFSNFYHVQAKAQSTPATLSFFHIKFRLVEPRAYLSILEIHFTSDPFRVSNGHSPKGKLSGILAKLLADHTSSMAYYFRYHMRPGIYLEMASKMSFLHLLSSASEGVEV